MLKLRIYIASVVLMIFVSNNLYSQKVGVVLSGGGPRGVTHIGVLKALEDNNIPIDYIVGCSMGAIIGGLYAAGYSPDEIERIMSSEDLMNWLSSDIDPQFKDYYQQSAPNASWQIFKLKYDSTLKAQIPTNIISPHKLDFGFVELFSRASAAAAYDFDNLLVPFRCNASDISESKVKTFNNGSLEKAVRASMTFPFYFKPIKVDGKLIFDGGLYNNFPVDILEIEFNPDVIIGSKAASNYGPPKEGDAVSMIQSMLMTTTKYDVPEDKGILIEPDLWSVNVTDFSNTKAFVDSGYVSTMKEISQIKKLVKRRIEKMDMAQKRSDFNEKKPKIKIRDIIIKGVSEERQRYVRKIIGKKELIKEMNDPVYNTFEVMTKIKETYFLILADEKIDAVYPEMVYHDGAFDLIFNISSHNRFEMELGGLVSSRAINEIFFQVNYNLWGSKALNLKANTYLGRFHNSLHVNSRLDLPGKVPIYMQLSYTLNGWNYFNTSDYFFEDETPSFLKQQDNFWSFDISSKASRYGKLSAQFAAGRKRDEYYQTNNFTRLDTSDVTYFDFYSPGVAIEFNTLNRKQYASEGTHMKLCGRFVSGLENNTPGSTAKNPTTFSKYHQWYLLQFKIDKYIHLANKLNMGFYLHAAISEIEVFHNYTSTILAAPTFEPLPEGQVIFLPQFRAHNFAAGGLKFIVQAFNNIDIRTEAYIFQPYREILKDDNNMVKMGPVLSNRYYILTGRVIYHAPFGPISGSIDYYDAANEPWLYNINIGYYIFNKRPFR